MTVDVRASEPACPGCGEPVPAQGAERYCNQIIGNEIVPWHYECYAAQYAAALAAGRAHPSAAHWASGLA